MRCIRIGMLLPYGAFVVIKHYQRLRFTGMVQPVRISRRGEQPFLQNLRNLICWGGWRDEDVDLKRRQVTSSDPFNLFLIAEVFERDLDG